VSADQVILDAEGGVEVRDADQARAEALKAIETFREEDAQAARTWSGWTLSVFDTRGNLLFTLDLDSIVRGAGGLISVVLLFLGCQLLQDPSHMTPDRFTGVLLPFVHTPSDLNASR
jgi:citrate lyase beta subunit